MNSVYTFILFEFNSLIVSVFASQLNDGKEIFAISVFNDFNLSWFNFVVISFI